MSAFRLRLVAPPLARWLAPTAALISVLAAAPAHATVQVETRSPIVLRERPQSSARIVERVPAKKKLQVVGKTADGIWYHVQGLKTDGWTLANAVEMVKRREDTEEEGKPLAKRRNVRPETWVSKSKYHDGEDNKLTVSATRAELYGRPATGGSVVGILRRGDTVMLVRKSSDGKWLLVDIGGGEVAWIQANATRAGGTAAVGAHGGEEEVPVEEPQPKRRVAQAEEIPVEEEPPPPPEEQPKKGKRNGAQTTPSQLRASNEPPPEKREDKRQARVEEEQPEPPPEPPPPPRKKRRREPARTAESQPSSNDNAVVQQRTSKLGPNNELAIGVRGGIAILQQRFTSNSTAELANYEAQTGAFAATVRLNYVRAFGRYFRLGVDGSYTFAGAAGVRLHTANAANDLVLGVQSHFIDLGVAPGVHFAALHGIDLRFRVGMAMQLNLIAADARAPLPSDEVLGMALGLRIDIPALFYAGGHAFGLRLFADGIVPATRAQTAGLEDGAASTTYGANFGGWLSVQLYKGLDLEAGYSYGFAATHFTGQSKRDPNATVADRGTAQHLIVLGIAYNL